MKKNFSWLKNKGCISLIILIIVGGTLWYFGVNSFCDLIEKVLKLDFLIVWLVSTLAIYMVYAISYFYFQKESIIKSHDDILYKLGHDITRLFSWLFSMECLLFVLVGATVAFVVVIINNFSELKDGKLQLTAFTLNLALCTLIPTLISRIVAKSHLDGIIEKKLETELNNFKTSLYGIRRDKGHSCRMSAELLYQNAEKEGSARNAIWSIGWASEAITQYLLIKDDYINVKERVIECMESIYKSFGLIKGDKQEIKHRDLVSVLTMYSLLNHYCWVEDMERSVREKLRKTYQKERGVTGITKKDEKEKIEKEIEKEVANTVIPINDVIKYFYDNREDKTKISGYACRITGMNGRFNKKIECEADNIIHNLENGK
jgi:hypothetical protein